MSRATLRRIRRLKADAAPAIEELARRDRDWEASIPTRAQGHLLEVIAVSRYGEPRIDEPLARARARATFKYGTYYPLATSMYEVLEKELPTGDIKSKLSTLVQEVPDWLIYFCEARFSMRMLGIEAPPFPKSIYELVPAPSDMLVWPSLPKGVLKPCADRGKEHFFPDEMSFKEVLSFYNILNKPENDWTRREHRFVREVFARKSSTHLPDGATKSNQTKHVADHSDDGAGQASGNEGSASPRPVDTQSCE